MDIYNYKGYKIEIIQDEFYGSPNDLEDNECFLIYSHRSFTVEKEGFNVSNISNYLHAKKEVELNNDSNGDYQEEINSYPKLKEYYIFPVEAYIHSGINLSLFTDTMTCLFDSSVCGYILIKKYLIDYYPNLNSNQDRENKAVELAEGLIESWNDYLSGNVYGYIIKKPNLYYQISEENLMEILNGNNHINKDEFYSRSTGTTILEEINSCWGFYGDPDGYILEEAKSVVDTLNLKNE